MLLESIGRSQALADAIGRIAGFGEVDKIRFREVLLEGLGIAGKLGLKDLLLTYVFQLIV